MLDALLDILYPPKCLLCQRVLERGQQDLCPDCRTSAPECPVSKNKYPFVDSWLSLWYYEDTARESLRRFKFLGKRSYAVGFGRLLAMKLQQEDRQVDLITWVPVSTLRRFSRGYDQDQLIARALSEELGVPCVACLRKVRHNKPQSGISGLAQRRANVLNAYKPVSVDRFAGKNVLLVDDILTTGATAGECARVLLTAGAAQVHLATVAAANKNKEHER